MSVAMHLIDERGQGWKRNPDTRSRCRERATGWEYTRDALSRKAWQCARRLGGKVGKLARQRI